MVRLQGILLANQLQRFYPISINQFSTLFATGALPEKERHIFRDHGTNRIHNFERQPDTILEAAPVFICTLVGSGTHE